MNYAELSARLDPHYSMKMMHLRESVYAKADIERFRANEAVNRENLRASNEMDRERFRADRDDSRHERDISAQRDVEEYRGQTARSVEEMRGTNARALASQQHDGAMSLAQREHENMLVRMEDDLQLQMTKSGLDSGLQFMHKMADEGTALQNHLMRKMEQRSQMRGDVFKMLFGAVIQEELAQNQHTRDFEKREHESSLRRAETYFNSVCAYLSSLIEKGREATARAEIDRLVREWERA